MKSESIMNVEGFNRMQEFKSINELKDVPFPECFHQCTVAQFSNNAYSCCEVHCDHKIVDYTLSSIEQLAKKFRT